MSNQHAAAYAKLATREQQQQQQEMTSIRAPGDAVDTRFLLHPPPYHAHNHSSSSTASPDESTPFTNASAPDSSSSGGAGSSSSTVDIRDDETGDGGDGSVSSGGTTADGDAATVAGLIELDKDPPAPGEATITLMRLGGTGLGNVQLNVPLNWRVGQLLQRVFAREIAQDHVRVRVVFMGRMLANDEVLGAAGVAHGCILHTHVMSGMGAPSDGGQQQMQQQQQQPLVLDDQGNLVPQGEVLLNDDDAAAIAAAEGIYPGQYTQAQIAMMRRAQFEHAQEAHAFAPREGTTGDLVLGFLLGFILGFISFIWLYSPTLTRKQRIGIMLGVVANIMLMLYNQMHPEQSTVAAEDGSGVMPDPTQPGGGIANG